jgi:hypothetical protein
MVQKSIIYSDKMYALMRSHSPEERAMDRKRSEYFKRRQGLANVCSPLAETIRHKCFECDTDALYIYDPYITGSCETIGISCACGMISPTGLTRKCGNYNISR